MLKVLGTFIFKCWLVRKKTYRSASRVKRELQEKQASSTSCERSFSLCELNYTDLQTCLEPERMKSVGSIESSTISEVWEYVNYDFNLRSVRSTFMAGSLCLLSRPWPLLLVVNRSLRFLRDIECLCSFGLLGVINRLCSCVFSQTNYPDLSLTELQLRFYGTFSSVQKNASGLFSTGYFHTKGEIFRKKIVRSECKQKGERVTEPDVRFCHSEGVKENLI